MAKHSFFSDHKMEPKRNFRWQLHVGNLPAFICTKVKKPAWKVNVVPHSYLNYEFKYPGRITWEPITLTLIDPVMPDAAASIMRLVEASGYHYPFNPDDTTTISKKWSVESIGNISLRQIGYKEGEPDLEEWTLYNPWVSECSFGELAYEDDKLVNIDLQIVYDFAKLKRAGTPVEIGNR